MLVMMKMMVKLEGFKLKGKLVQHVRMGHNSNYSDLLEI